MGIPSASATSVPQLAGGDFYTATCAPILGRRSHFVPGTLPGGGGGWARRAVFASGEHLHSPQSGSGEIDSDWEGTPEGLSLEQLSIVSAGAGPNLAGAAAGDGELRVEGRRWQRLRGLHGGESAGTGQQSGSERVG